MSHFDTFLFEMIVSFLIPFIHSSCVVRRNPPSVDPIIQAQLIECPDIFISHANCCAERFGFMGVVSRFGSLAIHLYSTQIFPAGPEYQQSGTPPA